jgi:hypothetical protein
MFSQTWKKYLPLITLFLKRSAGGPQKVQLNQLDFERALGGRKLKLSIPQMEINKGRINNLIKNSVLAKDLADTLIDNDVTKTYLRTRNIAFALTGAFELQITDQTPEAVIEALEQDNSDDGNNSIQPES